MAHWPTKQAKLDKDAHDELLRLQGALGSQRLPRTVDRKDILSAVVMYITPQQVAGMLMEYWWYTDQRARAAAGNEEARTD
jgi:hypothetical protein